MLVASILLIGFGLQGAKVQQIDVDARKSYAISPYIYGVNYPDSFIQEWFKEWDAHHGAYTLAREGGNRFSAYNWETNASNAGSDYFFQNDGYLGESNEPGWTVKTFLDHVQSVGAAALITVPTLGFVAADKDDKRDGGKDVNHSKDWVHSRFLESLPKKPGGKLTYPPDTNDHKVYQDEFVRWVVSVQSKKSPVWFSLDNEPDFWPHTHARISPELLTYKQIIENNITYASAIKSVAPKSLVFGPVNYGWYGMRAFQGAKDGNGRDFANTYLDQVREASKKEGKRLVDVYDFHWYPEATGDGVRIIYNQAPDKPGTLTARIQAPRSLWDPTYVEDSWITKSSGNKPIRLLPDFAERIAKHFPGTKLAITEYEFGGRNKISGALAQADALGVFGRFGLFAACHWGVKYDEAPVYAAFQSFTDFDRRGAKFGDRGLAVSGEIPAENSVYAALDSHDKNRLTLVVINKTSVDQDLKIGTQGFLPKSAMSFSIHDGVYREPDSGPVEIVEGKLSVKTRAFSITTIEVKRR